AFITGAGILSSDQGSYATHAYFTREFTRAEALLNGIQTDTAPPACANPSFRDGIYPRALFGRMSSRPLRVSSATDDGLYDNNPDRWAMFKLTFPNGSIHSSRPVDLTCLSVGTKKCSLSTSFPNGFNAWKSAADLD